MILRAGKEIVMAIGDMHCPFEHPDTLAFLLAVKAQYKPTQFVCLGDEIDGHALSDYVHDPDGMSAGMEHRAAIEKLRIIYKHFPKMKVCTSNHTARPFRKAFKAGIPASFLRSYRELLEAPAGWSWKHQWVVDGIIYEHGEGFSGERAHILAAKGNMQSTVIGHIHSFAGINYVSTPDQLLFGFNVGCLIDTKAYAFAYGANFKSRPIIGVGIVYKGVPVFVPMILTKGGRWIGKL